MGTLKGFKKINSKVIKFIEFMGTSFNSKQAAEYALGKLKKDGTPYDNDSYYIFAKRCLMTEGVGEKINAISTKILENMGLDRQAFLEKLIYEELPKSSGIARIKLLELIGKSGGFTDENVNIRISEPIQIQYLYDENKPTE